MRCSLSTSFCRTSLLTVITAALICVPSCEQRQPAANTPPPSPAGDWRTFEGTWNASGSRRTITLSGDRKAAAIDLSGSLLLTGADRLHAGFRAEAVGLADTETGFVGRCVWTDERGETVFGELRGAGARTGSRITGVVQGGTGRFKGITGEFEFTWHLVIETDDSSIQGRATDFKGRYRFSAPPQGARP